MSKDTDPRAAHDPNHAYLCAVPECPKYVKRQSDPRAALAEAVMNVETSQYPGAAEYGAGLAEYLAERGVLLVTEADLLAALQAHGPVMECHCRHAAAIFAALP